MADPIGFIGKSSITPEEEQLLFTLGRTLARAGKTLVVVPAPGACAAVMVGVKAEGGRVEQIEKGTLTASARCFVYADERLMARLRAANPDIDHNPKVFLLSSPLEIQMWLDAAKTLLAERNISIEF